MSYNGGPTSMTKLSKDTLQKIEAIATQYDFSVDQKENIANLISDFLTQKPINGILAQRLGQYFYYYAKIDTILTKIIESLLPELDLNVTNLKNSFEGNSYKKKLELVKSLTPNSDQLKIFPLLYKINSVRNQFAHENPDRIDFSKINQSLVDLYNNAFISDNKSYDRYASIIDTNLEIDIPVKIIIATKYHLDLFSRIEILGKSDDKTLKLFESLRRFSSLYIRKRFSVLAYKFQTGAQSKDVPESFSQAKEFEDIIKSFDEVVSNLLKK